jgi:hypothetical protein
MTARIAALSVLMATMIAIPATAHADTVPSVDQVTALLTELMDPNKPNADKNDVVTPDLSPDNVGLLDKYLDASLNAKGDWPYDFGVTDIQQAPNNTAGATVATHANGHPTTANPTPIVLVNQNGHWLMDRKAAMNYVLQVFSHYQRQHFGNL